MQRTVAILGAVLGGGLMSLAACSSSSSGSTAPNGDGGSEGTDGGSSGSSGASSGGSSGSSGASSGASSGTSSSGGTSSGGSSTGGGSSSGSGVDASGGGDTMLVGGRSKMNGLMVIGSNLYWIEASSGIFKVPVTGGTAQSVFADANIGQALGSDGTHLFFTRTSGTGSDIDMVGLDGTGQQVLASGVYDLSAVSSSGPQIFVVNGTVYVNGTSSIMTVSLAGGDAGADAGAGTGTVSMGSSNVLIQALFAADSSNIYFNDFTGNVYSVATGGGTPSMILAGGTGGTTGNAANPGDLVVVGGAAYVLQAGTVNQTINLMKSTGGAAATTVAPYTMENGSRAGLALDGNGGLYEFVGGNRAGVYDAPVSSGAQTAVDTGGALQLGNMVGALNAVDSAHIYYAAVGGGMFSIWSHGK